MKKNIQTPDMTRRGFLKTWLASGISTSILSSSPLISGLLFSRHAEAQGVTTPNKSVVIYIPGGGIHDLWAPTGTGENMLMGSMSHGYDSVKTQCHFLQHMSHENAGHGRTPRILSNRWTGDSYDVHMGKQLGPSLPFRYLNLGVHSNGHGYMTRLDNNEVPFEDNPFTVFKRLFGDSVNPTPKTPFMDAHQQAVDAIKNKLGGYEVARLDEHLNAIAQTKSRLDALAGGGTHCAISPDASEFELSYNTFTQQAKLQIDIAVAALQCNMTSSVSLALGNHQSEFRIPELNHKGSYHQSIHGGSDGQPNYPYYTEMRNHLGSLTAYFIQRLDEAGILDSTVVVETTDMGHADKHSNADVPLMIAGGGSTIRRGVSSTTDASYHNLDVLHTAAKACGVTLDYGREIPGVLS